MVTFEEKIDVIDRALSKKKSTWLLDASKHISFEDVCQIIRAHIYKKWALWDQSKPLEPWINRIISNQINNLLRNHYYKMVRPCLGKLGKPCVFNIGENECSLTKSGKQCSECPLYAKWEKKNKNAYEIKISSSLNVEEHVHCSEKFFDIEEKISEIHSKVKAELSPNFWKVYSMLYIEKLTDDEIAKKMNYKLKPSKNPRWSGSYSQLNALKKHFKNLVKNIVSRMDLN